MKTKHGLHATTALSLAFLLGPGDVRGQGSAGDAEPSIAPFATQVAPSPSPEERDVATRIDRLLLQLPSADPLQRKLDEARLREAVEEQFDLRQARLERELKSLRDEVGDLEELAAGRAAGRARAIARGVRRALLEAEWPGEGSEQVARAVADGRGGRRLVGRPPAPGPGPAFAPEERDLALRIDRLARQLATAASGERTGIEARLRDALGEQFDLRQARLGRALVALREEVRELDELAMRRREGRAHAIGRRLRSMGLGRD